jgi:alkylation response protein AidB-like acyl-CoA dehydrogenase
MQRWRLDLQSELEAFRSHAAARIAALLPADIRAQVAKEDTNPPREMQQRWHRLLDAEGGWGVFTWQARLGGPNWSLAQQYLFDRELAFADAPRPMLYGLWLGPTLAKFGTPEQVERFLPAIVAGETFWCQGFSEPDSGSDLASLNCKASVEGDHYVLNGPRSGPPKRISRIAWSGFSAPAPRVGSRKA